MSRGFSDTWKEELKSKNDIVNTLSKYLNLQQKGKNYWACCPFHHEKTPSFCINAMEQVYHCYGCKEHGDVITFIQKIESTDFLHAIEILAKNANMEIPTTNNDESTLKRKAQKDIILKVLDEAYRHYEENLYLKTSTVAQEYIKKRKMTKNALETFHLGYSVNWTEMLDHLIKKGFTLEDIKLAGIAESKNGRNYDVMGERLIFPIFNIHNECIGFSARSLVPTTFAKYKNSANNMVFDKSKTLFGINNLKKQKQTQKLDYIVIVEGQMDVIAMYQAGFLNVIACLGTAITQEHGKMLKYICENIVICLDGDSAGQSATIKTIDVLVSCGFNVKAVKLPNNSDPDEFIKENGADKLKQFLDNAMDYVEFKIKNKLNEFDLNKNDEKSRFVNTALAILSALKTNSEKQIYLDLIKSLTGVPVDVLSRDLQIEDLNSLKKPTEQPVQYVEDGEIKAVKFILACMLYKKDFVNYKFNLLPHLLNPSYIKLYKILKESNNKNEIFKISSMYDIFDLENEPNLTDIINMNFEAVADIEKYYKDCILSLNESYLKNKIKELTEQYKVCEDISKRQEIAKELNNFTQKLKNKCLEE